jgi:hypothetical protein
MGVKWVIERSWAVFITYVITISRYFHDNIIHFPVEQTNLICFMLDKRYSVITYFTRIATEVVGTGTSEDVYTIDTGPTIQACTRTAIINV